MFSRYLKTYLMSLSMPALLSLYELDMIQLAPELTRYKQPIAPAVISYPVKLIVVVRFAWINTDQVNLSLHSTGLWVDDDDDVFHVHIGVYLTVNIFQLVDTVQWP